MNKNSIIYLIFLGVIGLFSSCEKDETKVVILDSPAAPTLTLPADLTLQRTKGTDTLVFTGTAVDPGFQASATYFLEACASGTDFAEPVQIFSGIKNNAIKISVSDLNGILLKKFPADQVSSLDFRVRSVLAVDAGTGAEPMVYTSDLKTASVTLYGLPRLDLIANSTVLGKVESPLGDGKYAGFVKLDKTVPFTIKDPDGNIVYGDNSGALKVDGTSLTSSIDGWHKIVVDTKALTYEITLYSVGVVGAFTDWGNNPDKIMEYNSQNGYWITTIDLPTGPMKFRLNSAWTVNWGPGSDKDLPANGSLALPNSNGNVNITAAGNYTIQFTATGSSGSCTFIKNN